MIHFRLDPFDPRSLPIERPDDTVFLHLSSDRDCYCILDRQDYEWAVGPDRTNPRLWCHTYGSGSMNDETWTIERPDHIYARRSIMVSGKTKSGRQRYGNEWLHRCICLRAFGPPPLDYVIGDHLNGDTLDNRRCNLRWATRSMNATNVKGSTTRERFMRELSMAENFV